MTLTTSSAPDAPFVLKPEQPQDAAAIEALLDRAFGPGRHTKVSERVREFAAFAPELSFCAWRGPVLLGSVRLWRVQVGETPVAFLGPLAVDDDQRSAGVGAELVERASQAAAEAGETAVLLVGVESYFSRFGFQPELARDIRMPGPVDQRRVMLRLLSDPADPPRGAVSR